MLGIKVKIMLPWDPSGKMGPKTRLPDHVEVIEPKEEKSVGEPRVEDKIPKVPATDAVTQQDATPPPSAPAQPAPPAWLC